MVQSKVLASADGAKSTVREVSGMGTEGNKNYELWGVIEFVVDTGFPDNRRHCHFHRVSIWTRLSQVHNGCHLGPKEKVSSGEHPTLFYTKLMLKQPAENDVVDGAPTKQREKLNETGHQITKEFIMERVKKLFHPYRIDVRAGTEIIFVCYVPSFSPSGKVFHLER